MARCVSIYTYIKNLSVKTDNWLIGAAGLEVKGMYTSQKYSSLVLIDWDSTLCFQSGQVHAAKLKKGKKKTQTGLWKCHTRPHLKLIFSAEQCLQLWWLTRGGGRRAFYIFFFPSLFLHDVVLGLLSAIARMKLCDTAWPLTYCDELWVYLLRLSFFHLWQHFESGARLGKR